MHRTLPRGVAAIALFAVLATFSSCATIVGTVASPFTAGIDLCKESLTPRQWYWGPFVWIGGTIAGPFVALYNGVNLDASVFRSLDLYWNRFPEIFRPFHMLQK
jgi:hypothetical protein